MSSYISHKKNCCDQNFGESLHISLLSFPRFWTRFYWPVLIFILIYFELRDTENQQQLKIHSFMYEKQRFSHAVSNDIENKVMSLKPVKKYDLLSRFQ